jgi:hypothetical protein
MTPRCALALAATLLVPATAPPRAPPVLWAWERPEDLRFASPDVTIAVLAGSIRLFGDAVAARPRLQPALVPPANRVAGVAHIDIDRAVPLAWTPRQRARAAAMVLDLLRDGRFQEVQVDFEVRASERHVLLDLLADVRAGLAKGLHLSMTALASWCDTETWIDAAPVDEVVPMLFRMGPAAGPLRQRLAENGGPRGARCQDSLGVATDQPPGAVPPGRRIWIFNPKPWTADDLAAIRGRVSIPRQSRGL